MASLSIQNVAKSFARTNVLENISFDVKDGEFCVLLGPSGCGKSTLLRLVAGLESASSGKIVIGDRQVDHLPPAERDIAFVFQNYALYPHMTAFENLAFSLRLRGVSKEEIERRVREAASLLEIQDQLQQKPQQLSGGQRQRVAVGRAIVREPKIFLFDEPLSNLDAALRANMRIELARLHEKLHSTVLYVTHDQTEAMTLGEKIVILHRGKIQQIGPPSAIYHQPINTFVAAFVGTPQMNLIDGRIEEDGAMFTTGRFRLDLSGPLSQNGKAYAGKPLTIGIRPEDLHPTDAGGGSVRGEVDFIEDLGADRFLHVKCADLELVARANAQLPFHRGDILDLRIEPKRLHLFQQGKRVNVESP
jgi:multiple sugar transport system ATP-binding protein